MSQPSKKELPPIDGGGPAWRFLFATWIVEAMFWGFPLVFGIFESYYMQHPLFRASRSIPVIGTSAIGVSYLGMPLVTVIALRYPRHRQSMVCLGWLICILSLVAASFATRIWQLVLTQGILYGAGWVTCYTPFLMMLNEWWVQRRGLAYGILFGAGGVSSLILPFVLEALLKNYGFSVTLRVYAAAAVCVSGPVLLLIRPRGQSYLQNHDSRSRFGFLNNKLFYGHAVCILLQGLAFFVPWVFLPAFADSLGLGRNRGAVMLTFSGLAQVTGQVMMGHASDKLDVHIPLTVSTSLSGLAVLFVWGPAKAFFPLVLFSTLYGFFAGSYSVIWSRVCNGLTSNPSEEIILYSFFSFERGVGNVLSGTITGLLLRSDESVLQYALGRYKAIVWFTGIALLISSLGGFGYFWSPGPRGHPKDPADHDMHGGSSRSSHESSRGRNSFELEPLQNAFMSEDSD